MTQREFNEKYKPFTKEGFHNPMQISTIEVIKFVDDIVSQLVGIPGFHIIQIKVKYGRARFYSSMSNTFNFMVEKEIDRIFNRLEQSKL